MLRNFFSNIKLLLSFLISLSLYSCGFDAETYTSMGLYITIEEMGGNDVRIYFNDTRENLGYDFIEIHYHFNKDIGPYMNISMDKNDPYNLKIQDFNDYVQRVESSAFNIEVYKLPWEDRLKASACKTSNHTGEDVLEQSDTTAIGESRLSFSFLPNLLGIEISDEKGIYIENAYLIKHER